MSNYSHGDWYCKPANEEEAREIVERAVASGAINSYTWKGSATRFQYGVINGRVEYGELNGTKYTIEELRKKFLLPDEKAIKWSGEGLPPVGTICTGIHIDVNHGRPCVVEILKHNESGTACAVFWINTPNKKQRNLYWFSDFRPLRTERDQWVEDAAVFAHKHAVLTPEQAKYAAYAIYKAITSGQLKVPEVSK